MEKMRIGIWLHSRAQTKYVMDDRSPNPLTDGKMTNMESEKTRMIFLVLCWQYEIMVFHINT